MSREIIPIERVAQCILVLRDQRVMVDRDLAVLYGFETPALNQAVKRNAGDRDIGVNIAIMRAFVKLRQTLETNRELAQRFSERERHLDKHDEEIAAILEAIRQLMAPPEKRRRESGFHMREMLLRYRVRKTA